MRYTRLEHRFVEFIPDLLEPGVLYISLAYGTISHSCCCGCGQEVVTPLTPTDWKMTYDGETISLWPSVGNWNQPCRSHYVIERGNVIGANSWSDERISAERRRDKAAKAGHYTAKTTVDVPTVSAPPAPPETHGSNPSPDHGTAVNGAESRSSSTAQGRAARLWTWIKRLASVIRR
jgi:hypothetical protein